MVLLSLFRGYAQNNYPAVVTPFVKSTYSLRWQDYATNTELLRLSLILRDQCKSDLDIYL